MTVSREILTPPNASALVASALRLFRVLERQALAKSHDWYISLIEKGTQVSIHRVEVKGAEVQIEFTRHSGRKKKDWAEMPEQTVRLKFDKGYSLEEVKAAFGRGFGMDRFGSVVELTKGMTETDIVDLVGLPSKRLTLDSKAILYFDDMKLILIDGKLADGM